MKSELMMHGQSQFSFVLLSIGIAILSAYAALDLAGRVTSSRTASARFSWLICGSVAMGIGIWSMHYIGMLGYRMDMPVLYDWPTVLLSMLAAVLASALALYMVSRYRVASLFMGGGIARQCILSGVIEYSADMSLELSIAELQGREAFPEASSVTELTPAQLQLRRMVKHYAT